LAPPKSVSKRTALLVPASRNSRFVLPVVPLHTNVDILHIPLLSVVGVSKKPSAPTGRLRAGGGHFLHGGAAAAEVQPMLVMAVEDPSGALNIHAFPSALQVRSTVITPSTIMSRESSMRSPPPICTPTPPAGPLQTCLLAAHEPIVIGLTESKGTAISPVVTTMISAGLHDLHAAIPGVPGVTAMQASADELRQTRRRRPALIRADNIRAVLATPDELS
ncbi:hypothetical protein PENTCL1PPCAC_16460, partial [Pristionchus entomophagus]